MLLLICSGFHDRTLSDRSIERLRRASVRVDPYLILPPLTVIDRVPSPEEPLIAIGFSAGVVTAMANATLWRAFGGKVEALFALDGWGVPLVGNFPIYRLSHDYFTHWSSLFLGGGAENFYADPPADHLTLWSDPDRVAGWSDVAGTLDRTTALTFLSDRLARHGLGIIN
ncbi:hypothetical protein V0288_00035 [Pannus brasiliensis CCIBt3594]|uniref:Uncharacterized protein n=1 Tax=Pannus brasiliensis CCIBt3594 TaxID=1427578 RepID=A0AAW9QPI9_9CHRO